MGFLSGLAIVGSPMIHPIGLGYAKRTGICVLLTGVSEVERRVVLILAAGGFVGC